MGCSQTTGNEKIVPKESLAATLPKGEEKIAVAPRLSYYNSMTINDKSPLTKVDISKAVRTFNIAGDRFNYKIDYAYISQRGYYPNGIFRSYLL